jgi:hypothetical protein
MGMRALSAIWLAAAATDVLSIAPRRISGAVVLATPDVCSAWKAFRWYAPSTTDVAADPLVVPVMGRPAPSDVIAEATPLVIPSTTRMAASRTLVTHWAMELSVMAIRVFGDPLPSRDPLIWVRFMAAYSIWMTSVPAAMKGTSDTLNVLAVPIVSEYSMFPPVSAS